MGVVLLHPYLDGQGDTVRALEDLLGEARAGQLIGIAYVVLRLEREYSMGAAGQAIDRPIITRGLLAMLEDELGRVGRGEVPRET